MNKRRILFVGSFKNQTKDGSLGGQMFACNSLISSSLSNDFEWILLDSTADSNVVALFYKRLYKAVNRIFLFLWYLLSNKIDKCLIFTGDGYSFLEKGLMVLIAKFARKEVILCPRSGLVVNDVKKIFYRWFYNYVLQRVDVLVCQGESWKLFYIKFSKINPSKIIIIHNWLDLKKYSKQKNKSASDILKIGFLSWVDRNKGIIELLEAFASLKDHKVELHIAGDGMAMDEAVMFCKEMKIINKVSFYSWVKGEKKFEFLEDIDIYILPSYFEGYPNSLMEAMASALPCVATNVGSIPDLVQNNKNGLLIEPKRVDQIYQALKTLIENPNLRDQLGLNARRTIFDNNNIEQALTQFRILLN